MSIVNHTASSLSSVPSGIADSDARGKLRFRHDRLTGDVRIDSSDAEQEGQDQAAGPGLSRAVLKALNLEIPWRLIPAAERSEFVEAARKEWAEWFRWEAIRPATRSELR